MKKEQVLLKMKHDCLVAVIRAESKEEAEKIIDAVILAGANFVVSPALDIETIKLCNRYCIPMMPGVLTPTEAVTALTYGCDIIKIFPGNLVGPSTISSFRGPLPQGNFMPSGGVNIDNVADWIKAGACAVGTGSSLTKGAKTGDYAAITAKAQEFVAAVSSARNIYS